MHTCVFIDGANIDGVLGVILGRRPEPRERPRWDRVRDGLRAWYSAHQLEFVLRPAGFRDKSLPFYRALHQMGYKPIFPDNDAPDADDSYIRAQITALTQEIRARQDTCIMLFSHDGGYAPYLSEFLKAGGRVFLVGFYEWFAPALLDLRNLGAEILDLEFDLGAFDVRLPRPRFRGPTAA